MKAINMSIREFRVLLFTAALVPTLAYAAGFFSATQLYNTPSTLTVSSAEPIDPVALVPPSPSKPLATPPEISVVESLPTGDATAAALPVKEIAEASTVPLSTLTPPATTRFQIQVGVFTVEKHARAFRLQLIDQGLYSEVVMPQNNTQNFRVIISEYDTLEAAKSAAKRLKSRFDLDFYVRPSADVAEATLASL